MHIVTAGDSSDERVQLHYTLENLYFYITKHLTVYITTQFTCADCGIRRLERRASAAVLHVGESIFLHYYTFDFLIATHFTRADCGIRRLERRASAAVLA